QVSKDEGPTFPPGFTPNAVDDTIDGKLSGSNKQPNSDSHTFKDGFSGMNKGINPYLNFKIGGSILQVMEDLVEVETKLETIDLFAINALWGKFAFDFAISPLVGYSGGLLCVWDLNTFSKESVTMSDLFLAIRGESIILGDFNEVRAEHEHFGTTFNESWFSKDGFDKLVEGSWKNLACEDSNNISLLKKKFQALKALIKDWCKEDNQRSNADRSAIQSCDENSKYFQGIINKKRSQLAIRGVLVDGDWIEEPYKQLSDELKEILESNVTYEEIKKAVWDCGTNKSPGTDGFTFDFIRRYWKIMDQDVVNAVHEFFNSSKFPPGCNFSFITLIPKKPDAKVVKDFRPITLIGCIYKIIAKIMANRLNSVISDLISDVQSAFVSNRQILDGPFILNELLSRCNYRKTKAMIFKVDFEKDFDFVRWDFLDDILNKFGFGAKWRGWIQGCLNSSMGSILVNGNPTPEFKFHKRLKQGDPLSPFIFILVMESLNLSFNNILNTMLFKGIRIDDSLSLSHLFYSNDAIFIGKWEESNFSTIVHMLRSFFLALGLKINIQKSKLMGIGIPQEEVTTATNFIGCSTFSTPFNYFGVKVGVNLLKLMKKKVGNGVYTHFWDDSWLFDSLLMHVYPRLYVLKCAQHVTIAVKLSDSSLIDSFRRPPRGGVKQEQLLGLIDNIDSVILSNSYDRWVWSLESSGEFSVKTARSHIDDFFLPSINLSLCEIDLPSIICPICCCTGETCLHLLFTCNVARQILCKVARWWELDIPEFHSYEDWLAWLTSLRLSKRLKEVLKGVFMLCGGRTEVVKLLQEVEKKNSLEAAQKAKIKWAIEGDENSKYYHGVINKKRNQLSIRGILVEGTWIDSPSLVKIQWCKKKKKQSLVFKVDFKNAYDSVRWDHLDDIMRKFGFGEKWCMWIQSYLRSSRGSVIVNESPTEEFQFYKGLKQCDPFKSGRCMSRIKSWNETIERMACRLSKWKLKTLLIGGRLTLLKSVLGSMPIYHMSLFKVPKKVLHRESGGVYLADMMDRWFWALKGSGEFTVSSVKKMIDDFMLPEVSSKTRWIKAVPIKVNVHA
nr:RNA-directed DNA polymerase, eukaryota [Tanacetum cinerariifolium]